MWQLLGWANGLDPNPGPPVPSFSLYNRPLALAGLVCMAVVGAAMLYAAGRLYVALVRYLERDGRRSRHH